MPSDGVSRREFLGAGLAVGAAAMLGPSLVRAAGTPKTVRIGVIGVGERGTGLTRTLLTIPGVVVGAIGDIDPAAAANAVGIVEKATGQRPVAYTAGERDWENLVARTDLDAIVTATPWEWHAPIGLAAMNAGKYAGIEVPCAIDVEDCWKLVRTSEATGMPCMMLENVCYFRDAMAIMNMIRQGIFGELLHAAGGYQHDVRYRWIIDGKMTWRGKHSLTRNGCLYPTHQAGPISQWLNINHGDRYTHVISVSTKSMGINNYAAEKVGPDDPLAKMTWALGDVNTTILKTANGRTVTLYHDCSNYRPYDLMFRLQGTKGIYLQTFNKIFIHGSAPGKEKFEDFAPYLEEFDDPTWKRNEAEAKSSGHGGADYMTLLAFVEAVRTGSQTPIDVYDSVTWAAIHPLSCDSVSKGSMPVEFPDFTGGRWQTPGAPPAAAAAVDLVIW